MKKCICIALLLLSFGSPLLSQRIKLFEAFTTFPKAMALPDTRYAVVLEDNSVYWFSKEKNWQKVESTGLPAGYNVTEMDAYSKQDGGRIVVVLDDQSIWWYSAAKHWQKLNQPGLPAGKRVVCLSSYTKMDSYAKTDATRLVVVLDDNSMWWMADEKPWEQVPSVGLPGL